MSDENAKDASNKIAEALIGDYSMAMNCVKTVKIHTFSFLEVLKAFNATWANLLQQVSIV